MKMSNFFFIISEGEEKNTKKDKKSCHQNQKTTLYDVSLHYRDLTKILCGEKEPGILMCQARGSTYYI